MIMFKANNKDNWMTSNDIALTVLIGNFEHVQQMDLMLLTLNSY